MTSLSSLSDQSLMKQTKDAVASERNSTANVIRHFQEISDRKLFLDLGFPSLYEMVTKEFGYCAGSAMRRINSMRLVKELPEVEAKIASGELSLTAAANVQSFFYSEAKEARGYSREEKIELLQTCINKSSREVEQELCKRNPEREKRESLTPISEDRFRISFSISEQLNQKLEKLKQLLSHVDSSMTTETLLDRLAELGLDKFDPVRAAVRSKERENRTFKISKADMKTSPPAQEVVWPSKDRFSKRSRYIAAAERHALSSIYDGHGCQFIDETSGRRCGSEHFLQMDHELPFSHGGENTADNLRIICGAHNRLLWKRRRMEVRENQLSYVV